MKIEVKVITRSGRREIVDLGDGKYKVYLKKSPEANKANEELERFLSKEFGAATKILRGRRSRTKLLEVENGD